MKNPFADPIPDGTEDRVVDLVTGMRKLFKKKNAKNMEAIYALAYELSVQLELQEEPARHALLQGILTSLFAKWKGTL